MFPESTHDSDSLQGVRRIRLTKGQFAIVDEADFDRLSQRRWRYQVGSKPGAKGYATRIDTHRKGRTVLVLMHRFILDAPPDLQVDHINGNTLDNRRCNLRLATPSQNAMNSRKQRGKCSSQYRGVTWHKQAGKWQVVIKLDGCSVYIGLFTDERQAAEAYDAAARKMHGEFAGLNFPDGRSA